MSRQPIRVARHAPYFHRRFVFLFITTAALMVVAEIYLHLLARLATRVGRTILFFGTKPSTTCIPSGGPQEELHPGDLFRFPDTLRSNDTFLAIRPPSARLPNEQLEYESPEVPLNCLDDLFTHGALCGPIKPEKIDMVWAYINGSDIQTTNAWYANRLDAWASKKPPPGPKFGTFREFGELRYSLRSMLKNFRPSVRKVFVLGTDFPVQGCEGWRAGQIPQWLSLARRDGDVSLELVHHTDVFPPLKNKTILNSYAIETRIHRIPGLSKYYVHMNDDIFINTDMTNFDFYSSAFGPVFRVDLRQLVEWKPWMLNAEWPALVASNRLLDARFGMRARPHTTHISKTLGVHFMWEIESIWPDEFAATASHSFRNDLGKKADVYPGFMMVHYVVERWREALLWSFVVARLGGDDDEWDAERAWKELGGDAGLDVITVHRGPRETLDRLDAAFAENGIRPSTKYVYSSFDGYPYSGLRKGDFKEFPVFNATTTEPRRKCTISRAECFPPTNNVKASEVFKHVAFDVRHCGDCIVDALVNKSGAMGLAAFLPAPDRRYGRQRKPVTPLPVPRLPLSRRWNTTDFSLRGVLGGGPNVVVRDWVEQAIIRYRFVMGETPFSFIMMRGAKDIKTIQAIPNTTAIICLNDDVIRELSIVRANLSAWFEEKWPEAAGWEGSVLDSGKSGNG